MPGSVQLQVLQWQVAYAYASVKADAFMGHIQLECWICVATYAGMCPHMMR